MRPACPLVLLTAVVNLSACRADPTVCVGVGSPTAIVTVVDSVSGAPLARAAAVVLRSPQRVDSLPRDVLNDSTLAVGSGWPGTYVVEVRVLGYALWMRADVQIPDRCGTLEPARLLARMQRSLAG